MRDKLIELLKKKYDHYCDQCGVNKQTHYIENLADYLIANGVIVPPVKVGQTVWVRPRHYPKFVSEGKIVKLTYNAFSDPQEWIEYSYESPIIGPCAACDRIDMCLNTTVFLSREEAEAAVAKGD